MRRLAFAAVLALTGCNATTNQAAITDPSTACFAGLASDTRFQPLIPHIGAIDKADQASIDMLTSKAMPTEPERVALKVWAVARNTCMDMGAETRKVHQPPHFQGLMESYNTALVLGIARLYAGEINYGQFVTERQRLASEASRAWAVARTNFNAERRQAQAAQQAQAAADMTNAMILLQASQPRPAPMAPPVSCASRNVGGTVYTDCR